ncbi:MAG: DUF2267 domain-containing protein [Maricaulaceae bacterium]
MSMTGLTQFDQTIHLTNTWLNEIMEELGWEDRHRAYRGLRAVLHALRDRLPVESAAHLAAQLPMLVRGFYYEGWAPGKEHVRDRTANDFVAHVEQAFSQDPDAEPERIVDAVFGLLNRHVSDGEVKNVRSNLPEAIRSLWPVNEAV